MRRSAPSSNVANVCGDSQLSGGGELGHELSPWLRQDDKSIAFCTRCTAHVYVRTSGDWVVDEDGLRELCEGLLVRVVWPAE